MDAALKTVINPGLFSVSLVTPFVTVKITAYVPGIVYVIIGFGMEEDCPAAPSIKVHDQLVAPVDASLNCTLPPTQIVVGVAVKSAV